MRVIITGGTGSIGVPLSKRLANVGHEVIVLSRSPETYTAPRGVQLTTWDARTADGWGDLITADTAIINLAGTNIGGSLWTQAHKDRVLQSRLDVTRAVVQAITNAPEKPAVLLQASAVGIYGDYGQTAITEKTPPATPDEFRASVCLQWEGASDPVTTLGVRRVLLRIGIVLDTEGGALPALLWAARFGVTRLGSGDQWLPWVHNDDVSGAIMFLMTNAETSGATNIVAPHPVTNQGFMQAAGQLVGPPALIPVPGALIRLGVGEMANTMLDSQRVVPERLKEAGYTFEFPHIDEALANLLSD